MRTAGINKKKETMPTPTKLSRGETCFAIDPPKTVVAKAPDDQSA